MSSGRPLYDLLPSVHRVRDAELGYPLRSLLEAVEEELLRLRDDIDGLHDNWFAETCAEWVLPYLGDLLGLETVPAEAEKGVSPRAFVANTVRHRRRKGTPGGLEQVARDVTGWQALVVEYFQRLVTTQNLNHVRLGNARTPDLRDIGRLDLLGMPFDVTARLVDVRHADRGRGRYNIPSVGVHLWRLEAYPCTGLDARAVDAAAGRWTFDPAGRDLPLFTRPRPAADRRSTADSSPATYRPGTADSFPTTYRPNTAVGSPATYRPGTAVSSPAAYRPGTAVSSPAAYRPGIDADRPGPDEVPAPLRRLALHRELAALRAPGGVPGLLAEPDPAFRITLSGDDKPIPPTRMVCADLTGWTRPPAGPDGPLVAVDPVLGRFTLPPGLEPERVRVDFRRGFSGDIGAGPHDRRATLAAACAPWPESVDWQIGVSREHSSPGGPSGSPGFAVPGAQVVRTLGEAIRAWNARSDPRPGQVGVITVMDSATYHEDLTGAAGIVIHPGNRLLLVAARWPSALALRTHGGTAARPYGPFVAAGLRPHLIGSLDVIVAPGGHAAVPSELILDGLSIEGGITAASGDLDSLVISNCTLAAGRQASPGGGLVQAGGNPRLTVRLIRTICSGVRLDDVPALRLAGGIVHAGGDATAPALDAGLADVEVDGCTVLGRTLARSLAASDSILCGQVESVHHQMGYLRFSYAPLDSVVPRRYHCQPADAATAKRVSPRFSSTDPADPRFCRLAADCPDEIAKGAEDAGEMGAFRFLRQPRRMSDLAAQLDRHLRFGLEAGVFLAD